MYHQVLNNEIKSSINCIYPYNYSVFGMDTIHHSKIYNWYLTMNKPYKPLTERFSFGVYMVATILLTISFVAGIIMLEIPSQQEEQKNPVVETIITPVAVYVVSRSGSGTTVVRYSRDDGEMIETNQ